MGTEASAFWTAASTLASIGVLIVTAIYVYLTHKLARVAEKQAWDTARARVIASLVTNQSGGLLLLEFKNFGQGVAENLKVRLSQDIHQFFSTDKVINEAPFFKDGLRALPPQSRTLFTLGVTNQWVSEDADRVKHPSSFEVFVEYETVGRKIEQVFAIDVVQQFYYSAIDRNYLDDFGKNFPDKFDRGIRNIEMAIGKLGQDSPPSPPKRESWANWFSRSVEQRKRSNWW